MTEQTDIVTWWYDLHSEDEFSPSEAYQIYCEETDYESSEKTFSNLLLRLFKKKGMLDKPERGVYRLSDRGKARGSYLLDSEDSEIEAEDRSEAYELLVFYLQEEKLSEIKKAEAGPYKLRIRLSEIEQFKPKLADALESRAEDISDVMSKALNHLTEPESDIDFELLVDVPYYDRTIGEARDASNINSLAVVEGTIEYASQPEPETVRAEFQCRDCAHRVWKEMDDDELKSPYKCHECGSSKFELAMEKLINRIDFKLSDTNGMSESIKARFREQELTSEIRKAFKPGNRLRVSGVIKKTEPRSTRAEPYVDVLNFEQMNSSTSEDVDDSVKDDVRAIVEAHENPFRAFATSLAPSIKEAEKDKKVIAASLIGSGSDPDDRIHTLLLSNPGEGKSDMLESIKQTFGDVLLSDGGKSTGTGLVGGVEEEDGRWVFSAGKVVQADSGVLIIDEFDKMKQSAESLNRPMSEGTVEIDKATVSMSNINASASVIAAGNFEEYVDDYSDISLHLPDQAASLMDRWDLLLAIRERDNPERVHEAILNSHAGREFGSDVELSDRQLVAYRQLARQCEPALSEESQQTLMKWLDGSQEIAGVKKNTEYQSQSNREVDTLAKLTKMYARSELREETDSEDAKRAVKLFDTAKGSLGLSEGESTSSLTNGGQQ